MTDTSADISTSQRFSHAEIVGVLWGVVLAMLMAALDQTIVATALPTIAGQFGQLEGMSWVVTAYLLTSTATSPLFGKMSDLYGRKRLMQAAIALFVIGSAACGLAQSMTQLVMFRGLQGMGGGGLMALAFTIIADVVAPRERGRYQGYIAGVFAISSVTGPLLGGLLTEHLSWRLIFLVNIPIGIAAYAMTNRALSRLGSGRRGHRIDYVGAALMVAAVVCLLLALTWGGSSYAWTSPVILGLAAAALVLLALLVVQELRVPEPVLPPRMFRSRIVKLCCAAVAVTAAVMFAGIVFLPLHLQMVREVGASNSGLMMLPMMLGVVTGSTLSGRLLTRTGRYRVVPIIGISFAAAAYGMLAAFPALPTVGYLGVLAVLGIGVGTVMPTLMTVVQNAVDRHDLGAATSAVGFFRSLGASLGIALFGTILSGAAEAALSKRSPGVAGLDLGHVIDRGPEAVRALPPELRQFVLAAFAHAFDTLFLVTAGLALLTAGLLLFLEEVPLRSGREAALPPE